MPPPSKKQRPAAQWEDASSSTILPRPKGRNAANVSLSSTVGAPTPARPSSSRHNMADHSIASTLASTAKQARTSKTALTTAAARALTSADTSRASTSYASAGARPRGRPPKSILSTPASRGNRTIISPPNNVSFSDQPKRRGRPPKNGGGGGGYDTTASSSVAAPKKRGRPPKDASLADASTSTSAPVKRRGRPPASANTSKQPNVGLPKSRPLQTAPRYARPEPDSGSDVSLLDGEDEETSDGDPDQSEQDDEQEDQEALSSEDEARQRTSTRKKMKRKGWPSERERLRKWRRLSVEERECVTSEGGLIWRTAIPLLNSMPKNIRSMVADSLTRALNRIDAKLESGLVPPLARLPQGNTASSSAARRDLASSMLSWRLEEEGTLLRAENPDQPVDMMGLGMNGDITELETMLLPEAEHIVQLSKTLTHQSEHLETSSSHIAKLKRDRRLIKTTGSSDYPPNLDASALLSIANHNPALDPSLSSFVRLSTAI